jgi:ketosteroid isomerase-like protein
MANSDTGRLPASQDIGSVAADHIRLGYHYLDVGDIDGYGSLFDEQAVLSHPGVRPVRGRDALERFEQRRFEQRRRAANSVRHRVYDVVSSGRLVVALGRIDERAATADTVVSVDFVDVFTVSDDGLITRRRRYLEPESE